MAAEIDSKGSKDRIWHTKTKTDRAITRAYKSSDTAYSPDERETEKDRVKEGHHLLVDSSPAVFVADGGEQPRVAVVTELREVVRESRDALQHSCIADGQPVNLAARGNEPQGHAISIPPQLRYRALPVCYAAQVALGGVCEVKQVVPRHQATGEQVSTVWTEQIELLVCNRGELV